MKPIQQGKKGEEDGENYGDNKRDKVRLHKVSEEVSDTCRSVGL